MPLTKSGSKILRNMRKTYGSDKRAKAVFYASINAKKPGTKKWHKEGIDMNYNLQEGPIKDLALNFASGWSGALLVNALKKALFKSNAGAFGLVSGAVLGIAGANLLDKLIERFKTSAKIKDLLDELKQEKKSRNFGRVHEIKQELEAVIANELNARPELVSQAKTVLSRLKSQDEGINMENIKLRNFVMENIEVDEDMSELKEDLKETLVEMTTSGNIAIGYEKGFVPAGAGDYKKVAPPEDVDEVEVDDVEDTEDDERTGETGTQAGNDTKPIGETLQGEDGSDEEDEIFFQDDGQVYDDQDEPEDVDEVEVDDIEDTDEDERDGYTDIQAGSENEVKESVLNEKEESDFATKIGRNLKMAGRLYGRTIKSGIQHPIKTFKDTINALANVKRHFVDVTPEQKDQLRKDTRQHFKDVSSGKIKTAKEYAAKLDKISKKAGYNLINTKMESYEENIEENILEMLSNMNEDQFNEFVSELDEEEKQELNALLEETNEEDTNVDPAAIDASNPPDTGSEDEEDEDDSGHNAEQTDIMQDGEEKKNKTDESVEVNELSGVGKAALAGAGLLAAGGIGLGIRGVWRGHKEKKAAFAHAATTKEGRALLYKHKEAQEKEMHYHHTMRPYRNIKGSAENLAYNKGGSLVGGLAGAVGELALQKSHEKHKHLLPKESSDMVRHKILTHYRGKRKKNESVIYEADEKWSADVETDWTPPEGFFTQSPEKIARGLKRASKNIKQAISRLSFYQNRGGSNLSPEDNARLENAKKRLRTIYTAEESLIV